MISARLSEGYRGSVSLSLSEISGRMFSDRSRILPRATPALWRSCGGLQGLFWEGLRTPKAYRTWASFLSSPGWSELVDRIGRELTALLPIATTPSQFRIFGARGQRDSCAGANTPVTTPRLRLRDLDWGFGVMMWRDSSSSSSLVAAHT